MDLTLVSIVVLAALVFILSGMVGYLYWQQTRLAQTVQSIALAFHTHLTPPPSEEIALTQEAPAEEDVQEAEIAEDDRASVEETVEHVEAPPAPVPEREPDVDDYPSMTIKQLQELLAKKGIPFSKRDSKPTLIEFLKALST
jgi:hypothetical protein